MTRSFRIAVTTSCMLGAIFVSSANITSAVQPTPPQTTIPQSAPVVAVEPPATTSTVAVPTTTPTTTLDTLPPEQPVTTQPPATTAPPTTATVSTTTLAPKTADLLDPTLSPICAQIARPVVLRPGRPCRVIAYYGTPLSTQMGILGRTPRNELSAKIRAEVERWRKADPETDTVCAFEIIAIVAQASPGPSGLYRARIPASALDSMIALARESSCLVVLDLQVGWSTVPVELTYFIPWLSQPDVHLALDPEWDMEPGVRPGTKIGSMDAGDINHAISVLRQISRAPGADGVVRPKLLIVHRFRDFMIKNPQLVKPSPEVRLLVNMDGFGPPKTKINVYQVVRRGLETDLTGFKLFTINDKPMLEPSQVIELKPPPMFINYQ